jgi:hypothetical protein
MLDWKNTNCPLLIFEMYPPKLQKLIKQKQPKKIYVWSNVVCFVLLHWDLPSIDNASCCVLGIFGSPRFVGVHQLDLRLFGTMVWKLWIIESFSQWKLNKIKIENNIEIWGCYECCWKAFDEWDLESELIEFSSHFLELSVEDIDFWVDSVAENSNKLPKIGFGRKNQLSFQCVHTWANGTS